MLLSINLPYIYMIIQRICVCCKCSRVPFWHSPIHHVLHRPMQWQQKNLNHVSNSVKTPISCPHGWAMGCLISCLEKFDDVTLHSVFSYKNHRICSTLLPRNTLACRLGISVISDDYHEVPSSFFPVMGKLWDGMCPTRIANDSIEFIRHLEVGRYTECLTRQFTNYTSWKCIIVYFYFHHQVNHMSYCDPCTIHYLFE